VLRLPQFRAILVTVFLALWILSGIRPVDSGVWILENVLTLLAVAWVIFTSRAMPLSDLSWLLIASFLLLHEVGAHYTYELVPAGFWLRPKFGFIRNDYDRIVHFCFGLLLALPCYESLKPRLKGPQWLPLAAPVIFLTGMSGFYEIAEAYANKCLAPYTAAAYLSLQGDPFDAQNDMAVAVAGSLAGMAIIAVGERRRASLRTT
jgi:putative membrane protein